MCPSLLLPFVGAMAAALGVAVATMVPGPRSKSMNLRDDQGFLYGNRYKRCADENSDTIAAWRCIR